MMAMIKLDNGDYVNTALIAQLVKLVDGTWQAWLVNDSAATTITKADCDRILVSINGKVTDDEQ
ncbi:hypothetical protein [Lacticaseibacillus paracasei]|uniref:hypothetical protein n=1 Tax=Lacticaseibacillus paracasei TaxID=1597 RepID=UPI0025A2A392|nr:hypothetical protein [Lacticaseibacillus paracasei]MDM7532828.1 hypothetical protein [Lacticaseibacillus paracasei]